MKWGGTAKNFWQIYLDSKSVNYKRAAGDIALSSIVSPCVKWIQRTLPEAPIIVYRYENRGGKEVKKILRTHRLAKILRQPNAYYGLSTLLAGTAADYIITGNAYWILRRMGPDDERIGSIWWVPSFMMKPESDQNFIDYYIYTVDGKRYRVEYNDVVHFQNGFDPRDSRLGHSDLSAMLREIATDNEAANWEVALLANMGVPGVIISAAEGSEIVRDDAEEIKNNFTQNFTGSNRGKPMVLSGPVQVRNIAFSPEQMNLIQTRRVPEERVSAAIGVPAVVVGLGAGLDRSTFNNMAEAREAAYEGCIIPMQRYLAEQIQLHLVPNFGDDLYVEFDLSQVRVLQEDLNKLHQRIREDVKSGLISLNEGRVAIGEQPLGEDVWYVTRTITIVDEPVPGAEVPALPSGGTPPDNIRQLPAASGE